MAGRQLIKGVTDNHQPTTINCRTVKPTTSIHLIHQLHRNISRFILRHRIKRTAIRKIFRRVLSRNLKHTHIRFLQIPQTAPAFSAILCARTLASLVASAIILIRPRQFRIIIFRCIRIKFDTQINQFTRLS